MAGSTPKALPDSRRALRGRYVATAAASAACVRTVLAVQVLSDLFASLVLKIHVDIGWLAALLRNEPLEQQIAACGIDPVMPMIVLFRPTPPRGRVRRRGSARSRHWSGNWESCVPNSRRSWGVPAIRYPSRRSGPALPSAAHCGRSTSQNAEQALAEIAR